MEETTQGKIKRAREANEEGDIEDHEADLITNALEFNDLDVGEILTHQPLLKLLGAHQGLPHLDKRCPCHVYYSRSSKGFGSSVPGTKDQIYISHCTTTLNSFCFSASLIARKFFLLNSVHPSVFSTQSFYLWFLEPVV